MSQFVKLRVVDPDDRDTTEWGYINLEDVAEIGPRSDWNEGSILYSNCGRPAVYVEETMDEISALTVVANLFPKAAPKAAPKANPAGPFTPADLALLESLGASGGFVASDATAGQITALANRIKACLPTQDDDDGDDLPF